MNETWTVSGCLLWEDVNCERMWTVREYELLDINKVGKLKLAYPLLFIAVYYYSHWH